MERLHLLYKASSLSYIRFGSGQKIVLCFHGYGEDATSYSFFEKHAGSQFTFYAIDLPYHGQTKWNEGYTFSRVDLKEIASGILEAHGSSMNDNDANISLMGFSLGGRVALTLYEMMPSRIERLVLLAPDGLKVNFWYWLSTQTWAGNKLFALTMKHPYWFFGFLKLLNRLKLVNSSIFKFVNYYIGDKEVRRLLYARWTTLRKLRPGIKNIKSLVRKESTIVRLVYGMHDRIILPAVGYRFRNNVEQHCEIATIHSGHQLLHEKHVAEIMPALLH